ncbi:hypothetical protein ACRC6Q_01290 [Planococcus sp. SE5232]|uniref:hypothetical protein n=1 Tax=unclassified Planococcus (in: firmicutes) TaxID=2662419 RepID=UPI001CBCDF00|nr:hypothetical protein [Planococcus sp. 4-30]
MWGKLKVISSFAILIGVVVLLAEVDETFNLYNAPYLLIAGGMIGLIFSLIGSNKESSFLCRVGLHKYKRGNRDNEVPAMYVYTCERCHKQKRAASVV